MATSAVEICRLQIQRTQGGQILGAQRGKFIEKLRERLAVTLAELRLAIEGIKSARFPRLQNEASTRYPGPRYLLTVFALAGDSTMTMFIETFLAAQIASG